LEASESIISFGESGLTQDECVYIEREINKIAFRISPKKESNPDTNSLVAEYYEFKDNG